MNDTTRKMLTGRAVSGAGLLVAGRLATKGLDFVALLFLAKILDPAQFGIVAIAMTPIFIVEAIFELPLFQVLVRQDITRDHLDTTFTLGVIRGIGLAIVLITLAYPFSVIYKDIRLFGMICALSIAPAMRGLWNPYLAIYSKNMDFRRDILIDISGKLFSCIVAISLALLLRDYRAILIATISAPTCMVIVSYIIAPFRPRLSLRSWPLFSRFITWSTMSQVLAALNWQCDKLILARFVPTSRIGEFSVSNDLSYLPEQALIKPIIRPVMTAFATIHEDIERLRAAYMKTALSVLAIGAPVMVCISGLASPIILLVLGVKWTGAIPLLKWLSLSLIPALFIAPLPSLAMAVGRPEIATHQTFAETIIKIPLITVGAIFFGAAGVVVARIVSSLAAAIVAMWMVRGILNVGLRTQFLSTWRIVLGCLALASVLEMATRMTTVAGPIGQIVLLVCAAAAGMAAYLAAVAAAWLLSGRPDGPEAAVAAGLRPYFVRHIRGA